MTGVGSSLSQGASGSEKGTPKVLKNADQILPKGSLKCCRREPTGGQNDPKIIPKWLPNGMWDRGHQIIKKTPNMNPKRRRIQLKNDLKMTPTPTLYNL